MRLEQFPAPELGQDWSEYEVPDWSLFPLVSIEQRKKMAIALGSKLSHKYDRHFDKEEITADALYLFYNDKEAYSYLIGKKRTIPDTEIEQAVFLYNCVRKYLESDLKRTGAYGGVKIYGCSGRYNIYDEENEITPAAEEKLTKFSNKNKHNNRG